MPDIEQNSQEKLESMLREGKISRNEFDELVRAMKQQEERGRTRLSGEGRRKRLTRSWRKRALNGICAGIAENLGVEPLLIRILAVILFFVAGPLTIIGYIVLTFLLPWDDPEAAYEPSRKGHPWLFGIALISLLLLMYLVLNTIGEYMKHIYVEIGSEVPTGTMMVFDMSYILYKDVFGIILQVFIVTIFIGLYLVCHNRPLRRVYVIGVVGMWLSMIVMCVFALLSPYFTLIENL